MKIGFVLLSPSARPIPSTRVAVLNMLPFLEAQGVECEILFDPKQPAEQPDLNLNAREIAERGIQVVCFQKVRGPSAEQLARDLRAAGVGTLFLVCDVIDESMCEATDHTAVVTSYLRSLYPTRLQSKISVVHDGVEHPEIRKLASVDLKKETLNAVLVTSVHLTSVPVIGIPPAWMRVTIVGPYASSRAKRLRQDWWTFQQYSSWSARISFLRFLISARVRRASWSATGVYDDLTAADVGIIPIETSASPGQHPLDAPLWKRKSENRLTLKMAVGLPVVATPIPAYEAVIRQGRNGYLATNKTEWLALLARLRAPDLRNQVGRHAREDALSSFSMRQQAHLLYQAAHAALPKSG